MVPEGAVWFAVREKKKSPVVLPSGQLCVLQYLLTCQAKSAPWGNSEWLYGDIQLLCDWF